MKELKCPKCGNVFSVDEADYALLLNQVKNAEFETELARRMREMEQMQKARQDAERQAAEARLAAEQSRREQQFNQQLAQEQQKLQAKQAEIEQLKLKIDKVDAEKQLELQAALQEKDKRIQQLENAKTLLEKQAVLDKNSLKEDYETKLKLAKEQVEYYKDLKIKLSTKMVGETLEQHCYNEFTRISPLFPYAEFHKDNDVIDGTKGDFVFRDKSEDGVEYISIMFEMKNENDETATKHKNQDFFHKLDEDRKKKNCEYAVLVSMLEPENDLYNNGIVSVLQNDKGDKFEKMYVIRPQFFVPLITLLTQTTKNTIGYRRELALVKAQQVDVTNFEAKLTGFQEAFGKHVLSAHKNYEDAIKSIDASIRNLENVKKSLTTSANQLRLANNDAMDLSIRKLTWNNPTMKAKFDEAAQTSSDVS